MHHLGVALIIAGSERWVKEPGSPEMKLHHVSLLARGVASVPAANWDQVADTLRSVAVLDELVVIVGFQAIENDLQDGVHVSDILRYSLNRSGSISYTRYLKGGQILDRGL